jgi:hypothetical protein
MPESEDSDADYRLHAALRESVLRLEVRRALARSAVSPSAQAPFKPSFGLSGVVPVEERAFRPALRCQ